MRPLVDQQNGLPTRKIGAVIGAGLTTTILVAGLAFGVEIPEDVVNETVTGVVAAVNLIAIVAGYFVRDRDNSEVTPLEGHAHSEPMADPHYPDAADTVAPDV